MNFEEENGALLEAPFSSPPLPDANGPDLDGAAEDTLGTVLVWLTFYAEQLACTDWTTDEKIAFLEQEENRSFLDHFSDARRDRIQAVLGELSFD